MPALVAAYRRAWSATPGTTDALAPFGVVSLSTGDSEGASDIGSFRWAQQGSYGVLPNAAMPNTFLAHVSLPSLHAAPMPPPPLPHCSPRRVCAGVRPQRPVGELRQRPSDDPMPRVRHSRRGEQLPPAVLHGARHPPTPVSRPRARPPFAPTPSILPHAKNAGRSPSVSVSLRPRWERSTRGPAP